MKRHTITAVCSALLLALALSGCGESGGEAYEAAADEIALQIQLSLQEDIGLLLIDYEGGTSAGGGGTSHADKSLSSSATRGSSTRSASANSTARPT